MHSGFNLQWSLMSLVIARVLTLETTGFGTHYSQSIIFSKIPILNIIVIPAKVAIHKHRQGTVFFFTHRPAI